MGGDEDDVLSDGDAAAMRNGPSLITTIPLNHAHARVPGIVEVLHER